MLKHLFPSVRGFIENYNFGSEWDQSWAAEQRAASSDYFDRYFLYAVPKGDVADTAMGELFAALDRADVTAALSEFSNLVNETNAERVIRKLRTREDKINLEAARTLITVLVIRGHALPNPKAFFSFLTARAQATILIDRLLKRHPGEQQADIVQSIVADSPDLGLAAEVFRRVRYSEEDQQKGLLRRLSDADEERAKHTLVERIAKEWKQAPFYVSRPGDASLLLHLWARLGAPGEEQAAVNARITEHPQEALGLLSIVLGQSWSMETGLPVPPEFEREQYESIAGLADPLTVLNALEALFPAEVKAAALSEHQPETRDDTPNLALARQFAWMHAAVTKAKAKPLA